MARKAGTSLPASASSLSLPRQARRRSSGSCAPRSAWRCAPSARARAWPRAQGLSVSRYTLIGLAIAGGSVAAAGALTAQNQSFADVNMGVGVLVNGLASLIVGEQLTGRTTLARQILAAPIGAIVYFQLVSLALSIGLQPSDLKLFTGLLVLLLLAGPRLVGRTRPAL